MGAERRYPAPTMSRRLLSSVSLVVVTALTLSACANASGDQVEASEGSSTTTVPPTTTTTTPTRAVEDPGGAPFAAVGGITLLHPSARVERVGFHQSNHEGARDLEALPTAVAPVVLEDRERLTGPRSAADIVVDPETPIVSPVDGVVKRSGTYVLYCEHSDGYAVVAPDANPAWEVKLLHISGVRVSAGDRVAAGETVLADGPTPLPFESQVDEIAPVQPAWPHVHLEVVDPSIPNIPSPGGGC